MTYIKQITIQGFKSYRDQVIVDPFHPAHNVVVGPNGWGKSNFFQAIQFVLSDSFGSLSLEDRVNLIHSGIGAPLTMAFVEIVFDNSSHRFPTGRDEVVLRRTINNQGGTQAKDIYTIDKNTVTKTEVFNLLESAGFSRSNPYYIVPQGRIADLANAQDAGRLQVLKEVAGTKVYEDKRQETLKIVTETNDKRKQIDEMLADITKRLEELEEEKAELDRFQALDQDRRMLEHCIYSKELADATEKLREMEQQHQDSELLGRETSHKIAKLDQRRRALELQIKALETETGKLLQQKQQVDDDRQDDVTKRERLQQELRALETAIQQDASSEASARAELDKVDKQIAEKDKALSETVLPQFQRLLNDESSLKDQLETAEVQLAAVYSRQDRKNRFATKKERDAWINKEIANIKTTLAAQTKEAKALENETADDRRRQDQLSREIDERKRQIEMRHKLREENRVQLAEAKERRDQLHQERHELQRQERDLNLKLLALKDELGQAENALGTTIAKDIRMAMESVRQITQRFGITGVHGPLFELFEVEDSFRTAVEVTAGASLFHIVVDTDDTAQRVLEVMNREKSGRITFMPLNRLRPKSYTYPAASNEAIPLIKRLKFNPIYRVAMEQVFGKCLVCRDLEVASAYAKSHSFNCITLEGDEVNRKGALTGGYRDQKTSRLEAIKRVKRAQANVQQLQEKLSKLQAQIDVKNQEVTQAVSEETKLEKLGNDINSTEEHLRLDVSARIKELANLQEAAQAKTKSLASLQTSIKAMQAQIESLTQELGTDLADTLSPAEQREKARLTKEIETLKRHLAEVTDKRVEAEAQRNALQSELNNLLRPRQAELKRQLEEQSQRGKADRVADVRRQLADVERDLNESSERLRKLEAELEENDQKSRSLRDEAVKLETEHKALQAQLKEHSASRDKSQSRQQMLQQKKEAAALKLREVGTVPSEAANYLKHSLSKLEDLLRKTNEKLKKFSHVNKKAVEQYRACVEKQTELKKRQRELEESAASIQELVDVLDKRKDEAIQRTFRQVAKHFGEIFAELVPGGWGRLIMQKYADSLVAGSAASATAASQATQATQTAPVEQYVGVAIEVCFDSKKGESHMLQQLSGGQKTLVALALIFAIQRCDPAPFYLFDEILANLDREYRVAVCAMITRLSKEAQFITTTFHPEMLENADKFYAVTLANKASSVVVIDKETAANFLRDNPVPA